MPPAPGTQCCLATQCAQGTVRRVPNVRLACLCVREMGVVRAPSRVVCVREMMVVRAPRRSWAGSPTLHSQASSTPLSPISRPRLHLRPHHPRARRHIWRSCRTRAAGSSSYLEPFARTRAHSTRTRCACGNCCRASSTRARTQLPRSTRADARAEVPGDPRCCTFACRIAAAVHYRVAPSLSHHVLRTHTRTYLRRMSVPISLNILWPGSQNNNTSGIRIWLARWFCRIQGYFEKLMRAASSTRSARATGKAGMEYKLQYSIFKINNRRAVSSEDKTSSFR
ncbi:hypothetical protein B0H16DRAFT_701845 [Mycena metata]|uniref:Uncharacterized protein n=1 Tax=Mycena metata TaxID=1033252 RepID=A0AAD7GUT0_9AGAR|nr:hypothetical protein B0H16DRAFT_701845 [Mycena metata]